MSFAERNYHPKGGSFHDAQRLSFNRNYNNHRRNRNMNTMYGNDSNIYYNYINNHNFSGNCWDCISDSYVNPPHGGPVSKKRKFSADTWRDVERRTAWPVSNDNSAHSAYRNPVPPARLNAETSTSSMCKRDRLKFEEDDPVYMSREKIERCSPSRKDGIDALHETHLRYSYCAFLQNLGMRLELPQTTIGTAMVLCHRFFVRMSHACHDRFLIATAALFLASKSEETPRPLNNVLKVSSEIYHKQNMAILSYLLPVDWFEQYRERVLEAEQMILTTLNFELNVQHPYAPLTSILDKIGYSQTVLVNLALNLISEGLRSSLWLQFKPHHIAAGAAYLAARFLNLNLACCQNIWQEFQTTPAIMQDVARQLMELL